MLSIRKSLLVSGLIALFALSAAAVPVVAGGNEYDAVCDHLEEHYGGKKVKVPFMWLARMAVGIIKPAGVKSFKVTIYRGITFSREELDGDMRSLMREAFDDEWTPVLRVVSKNGQQAYLNMREYKNQVKILMVTIENDEAVVVRARFDPDKLAEFINNPKIFGIDLDGKDDNESQPDPAVQPSALADH
jgi:hypothetical protein